MNIKIKEKYNNFINIIDSNAEINDNNNTTMQINNTINGHITNLTEEKKCICNTSSSELLDSEINDSENNDIELLSEKPKNSLKEENFMIKDNSLENNMEYIDDDNESEDIIHNIEFNENNNDYEERNNSEFNKLFEEEINITNKLELTSKERQIDNLEKLYNDIIIKKMKKNKTKYDEKKQENEENQENQEKSEKDINEKLKNLCSDIEEKVFIESTRGFNIKEDIYILRMDKLQENLMKYNYRGNDYSIGYLYRNYNNSKSYINKDLDKYWLNTYNDNGKLVEKELESKNKLLKSCLKNFSDSNKFKKKINDNIFRAFKKTVQIYKNELIIDIIFYVKYKINNI